MKFLDSYLIKFFQFLIKIKAIFKLMMPIKLFKLIPALLNILTLLGEEDAQLNMRMEILSTRNPSELGICMDFSL